MSRRTPRWPSRSFSAFDKVAAQDKAAEPNTAVEGKQAVGTAAVQAAAEPVEQRIGRKRSAVARYYRFDLP